MNFDAYRLRGCIRKDKSRIEKSYFDDFIIDMVGDNALLIARYYKYPAITRGSDSASRQLHALISRDASTGSQLKDAAQNNRFNLFEKKIEVRFGVDSYDFEIKGVGSQAIRLSRNFTYDEIVNASDSISMLLSDLIDDEYSGFLKSESLTRSLKETWLKEEAEREKRMKEIKEAEDERKRKQEELEAFLNS